MRMRGADRVADGVSGDGRLMSLAALAAVHARLDEFFGIVPGCAGEGGEVSGALRMSRTTTHLLHARICVLGGMSSMRTAA